MSRLKSLLFAVIACVVATQPTVASQVTYYPGLPLANYVFDFTAFPLGRPTPFVEPVGGLTIIYTAPNDPSAFKTVNSGDIPATSSPSPWLLGEAGSSELGISFSSPVYGIMVEFLRLGPGPIQMDLLTGGLFGSVIASLSGFGTIPTGLTYPEGIISMMPVCVCANNFDAVRLSDLNGQGFGVHRILVAQQVPEPLTAAILGLGLAGLGFSRRRKLKTA